MHESSISHRGTRGALARQSQDNPPSFAQPTLVAPPTEHERRHNPEANRDSDKWIGDLHFKVAPDEVKRLSQVSEWRAIGHIAYEWMAILAAIWACTHFWHPLGYVVAVMWIGARQHALTILMHEATHYRVTRRKALNDVIGECFLAWPMFVTLRAYRRSHFAHHRFINTDEDPDWVRKRNHEWEFPKSWRALLTLLLKDLTGLNSHQFLAEVSDLSNTAEDDASNTSPLHYTAARVVFYLCLLGALLYFRVFDDFLLFWVVPILTWFKVIFRIRGIAEHYGIDNTAYGASRTTLPSLFEKAFIAPKNVNYHLEHHLYPSVPFYRLPALHNALVSIPGFTDSAHITRTYWGVLKECCGGAHHEMKTPSSPGETAVH